DLDVEEEQAPPPSLPSLPDEDEGRELVMPVPEPARSRRAEPEPEPSGARARWLATAKGEPRAGRETKPAEADRHPMPRIRNVPRVAGRRTRIGPALPWRWIGIAAVAIVALGLLAWAVLPGMLRDDRGA